jgi:hypothetical protein
MATSLIGGRSQSTRREPPTMGKQLVDFITCDCRSSVPFLQLPWYSWNIAESGVKHNKSNQSIKIQNDFHIILYFLLFNSITTVITVVRDTVSLSRAPDCYHQHTLPCSGVLLSSPIVCFVIPNKKYNIIWKSFWILIDWFDLLCLTPLSAIFQLYHGDQF